MVNILQLIGTVPILQLIGTVDILQVVTWLTPIFGLWRWRERKWCGVFYF